jgi:hypothetical protein
MSENFPMPFELWRQDDNGNRFLIDIYDSLAEAETRLAELSRVPHKQTYWITELSPHNGDEKFREK